MKRFKMSNETEKNGKWKKPQNLKQKQKQNCKIPRLGNLDFLLGSCRFLAGFCRRRFLKEIESGFANFEKRFVLLAVVLGVSRVEVLGHVLDVDVLLKC